jgi:hypothetical protein
MSVQINNFNFTPGVDQVEAHGTFNGWGALTLVQQGGSTVYTNTANDTTDANGATLQYKFVINGSNWENPATGQNRAARLPLNSGASLVLPTAYFNDAGPNQDNQVTFQVDMAVPASLGTFDPLSDTVTVRGGFNYWGTSALANDPSILITNQLGQVTSNVYVGTFDVVASSGAAESYKFYYYHGAGQWDLPIAISQDAGGNRYYANVAQTLPVVYFCDLAINDVLQQDLPVSFKVNMNGAMGVDSHSFDASQDTVYINGQFANYSGEFANWYPWWNGVAAPAQYQLYETPVGSGIYSNTVVIPKGTPVGFEYKYGIGIGGTPGPNDDEAVFGQNHYRVARSTATGSYAMPLDTFGNQYHEVSFGSLAIGGISGGRVPIMWLGRPGVHLQARTNLVSGVWQDYPLTDGTDWVTGFNSIDGFVSQTNWPANGNRFFRLIKP